MPSAPPSNSASNSDTRVGPWFSPTRGRGGVDDMWGPYGAWPGMHFHDWNMTHHPMAAMMMGGPGPVIMGGGPGWGGGMGASGAMTHHHPLSAVGRPRHAPLDVTETDKEYRVVAEMPGISKDHLQVHVVDGKGLLIEGSMDTSSSSSSSNAGGAGSSSGRSSSGHRQEGGGGGGGPSDDPNQQGVTWVRRERASASYSRTIQFPHDIDPKALKASMKDGLLTVVVPKLNVPQQERVPINIS